MRNKGTAGNIIDRDYDIYIESHFHEIICSERKRTERSRRPFLLALFDIGQVFKYPAPEKIIKKIVAALSASVRETDPRGWYRRNDTIGAVLTEFTVDDDGAAIALKIREGLSESLSNEVASKIGISFHIFPEKPGGLEANNVISPVFYPDKANGGAPQGISRYLKRGMDIIGSIFGLVIFSPFFILCPVLIKLSSKGPVLFRQERVGLSGKKFRFLKFRTMYAGCDSAPHQEYVRSFIREQKCYSGNGRERVYKIKDDPRVTFTGKILRKGSIDELPQFINVLKGDMSLVGPRPPIPYEIEAYDIWHKKRMLEVKPGITGLWQVSGRSRTTFDAMVRLDIHYIRKFSLWMDLKILARTPMAIISGSGY